MDECGFVAGFDRGDFSVRAVGSMDCCGRHFDAAFDLRSLDCQDNLALHIRPKYMESRRSEDYQLYTETVEFASTREGTFRAIQSPQSWLKLSAEQAY